MNEVNKTLFIPLYGKAMVSKRQIILCDPAAERIWGAEGFPLRGKSRSKWLCCNVVAKSSRRPQSLSVRDITGNGSLPFGFLPKKSKLPHQSKI